MPRIRTVKPEFWTSEQVMECSTNARLLFIGLWNFCDDAGRHPLSAKTVKAEIFPSDDFTASDVLGMIQELATNDLVLLYRVEGKDYIQVTGWHHQRIDKAQKAKYPRPPDDHSKNVPGLFDVGKEGKVKDAIDAPLQERSTTDDLEPPPEIDRRRPKQRFNHETGIPQDCVKAAHDVGVRDQELRDEWRAMIDWEIARAPRGMWETYDPAARWRGWLRNRRTPRDNGSGEQQGYTPLRDRGLSPEGEAAVKAALK